MPRGKFKWDEGRQQKRILFFGWDTEQDPKVEFEQRHRNENKVHPNVWEENSREFLPHQRGPSISQFFTSARLDGAFLKSYGTPLNSCTSKMCLLWIIQDEIIRVGPNPVQLMSLWGLGAESHICRETLCEDEGRKHKDVFTKCCQQPAKRYKTDRTHPANS